jgi:adenosylcobinamide-phosphate synthase
MAVEFTLLAILLEAAVGYPDLLGQAIGHPVTWIGRLIDALDRLMNRDGARAAVRRAAGIIAVLIVVIVTAGITLAVERALMLLPFGLIAISVLASTLIAQRSLHQHVARVAVALENDSVPGGRAAVAHIVGRDPAALDAAGVARAAIESLAENFSDAVVAPVFWMIFGGLPGGAVYKAINTADSMLGHRTRRHEAFGYAAARLDDLVNFPAARISALLIVAAATVTGGASAIASWGAVVRDAHRHRSPNAGYPEAAFAGALGLALAGPRVYGGLEIADAIMGDGRREATAADVRAALALYRRADAMLIGLVAALTLILISTG